MSLFVLNRRVAPVAICGLAALLPACAPRTPGPRPARARPEPPPAPLQTPAPLPQQASPDTAQSRWLALDPTLKGDHPPLAVAAYNRGRELAAQNQTAEAEAAYRRALQIDPRFAQAYVHLGHLMIWGHQRPADAEPLARQAIQLLPDDSDPWLLLAIAQAQSGQHAEAEKSARRAVALATDPLPCSFLTEFLMIQQQNTAARQVLDPGLARWPDAPALLAAHADLLRRENKPAEAVAAARRAVAVAPDHADAHRALAFALDAAGHTDEARSEIEAWVRLAPDSVEARLWLAIFHYIYQRYDDALSVAREVLKLQPDLAAAHRLVGRILLARSDFAGALAALRRAIAIEPGFAETHLDASVALSGLGRRAESEREYAEYQRLSAPAAAPPPRPAP